jgi:hypothetical protein
VCVVGDGRGRKSGIVNKGERSGEKEESWLWLLIWKHNESTLSHSSPNWIRYVVHPKSFKTNSPPLYSGGYKVLVVVVVVLPPLYHCCYIPLKIKIPRMETAEKEEL